MNEQQERRSALDDFAAMSAASPPMVQHAAPLAQSVEHVGAIAVAVRRDETEILRRIKALAAAAGQEWFYRFPVKNRKENRTDYIEGPSIKLANEIARLYGNCETDIRVQDLGDAWLFYARFIDLETGYSLTRPFQQRKSAGRIGGDDDARKLDIAFQIGASKAIRNVVTNALQTFCDFAFEEARNSLVERIGKNLEGYRHRTGERLDAKHVDIRRVETVIGRTVSEWLAPDIARIIAMMKAVEDGMASLDETFPPLTQPTQSATATLDQFATDEPAERGSDDQASNPPARSPRAVKARSTDPTAGDGGDDAANAAATSPADNQSTTGGVDGEDQQQG
jgi:hypothetical protein